MSVESIELAPGLTISRVITGLWQIADMERDGKSLDLNITAASMKPYLDAGFTSFDMADHYGSAELIAGIFKKKNPGTNIQLFTKWVPNPETITRTDVRNAVQRSLDRLQVSSIDLMQFHAWTYFDPAWLDCLYWLKELQEEGLIQHVGLTNFDTAHLRIAVSTGIKIVSNQICYSMLDQRASEDMTAFCVQHNIKLLAFGTIAGGFLTEKWLHKSEPKEDQLITWSEMKYKRFIDAAGGWHKFQELLNTLDFIARQYNTSIANIASKYILEQPAVAGIIIGSRLGKSEHIKSTLQLFDITLSKSSKAEIKTSLSLLDPIPGDCGDEYRKPPFLTASGDLSHHVKNFPAPYPIRAGSDGRTKVLSGTIWEDVAGFSRAIRKGNAILVSGTTATHGDKFIGDQDVEAQTHFAIDKIEGALHSLGSSLDEVVRTRVYVRNMSDWEAVARIHGLRFKDVQPANTLVRADLVGDEYLVEIEAEALVGTRD